MPPTSRSSGNAQMRGLGRARALLLSNKSMPCVKSATVFAATGIAAAMDATKGVCAPPELVEPNLAGRNDAQIGREVAFTTAAD